MLKNPSPFHNLAYAHGSNILGTIPVYPFTIKINAAVCYLSLFCL